MMYDTIIVGAGICGLSAAIELSAKGQKVLILEAQDYIGGRAKSVDADGVAVNVGAHWFHGGDLNPFYQWAKARYDLGPMAEDTSTTPRQTFYKGRDMTDAFERNAGAFDSTCEKMRRSQPDRDWTIADVAGQLPGNENEIFSSFMTQLWMSADKPEQVCVADMADDPLGLGGWQMLNGMSFLMDRMVTEAKDAGVVVQTGAVVSSVVNNGPGVRVTVQGGENFTAAQCLVTASVNVLKHGDISFDADVADRLGPAMNGLVMGNFYKAVWRVDPTYLESKSAADFFIRLLDPVNPQLLLARPGGKPVICMLTAGAQAREMETWDMPRVTGFLKDVLTSTEIFNDIGPHLQGEVVTTGWGLNPFTRGAYSFRKPGGTKSDPLQCGRIVFAGEAWLGRADESPGQMAGAWLSARKAATLILA